MKEWHIENIGDVWETQEHFRNAIALTESENKALHTIIGELHFSIKICYWLLQITRSEDFEI